MAFINYAVQSAIIMGIFCLVYHLFFRKLTFFTINRYFLIFSLLLSLAIPLIKIEVEDPIIQDPVSDFNEVYSSRIQADILSNTNVQSVSPLTSSESGFGFFNLQFILATGYLVISGFLLFRLMFSVARLILKARTGTKAHGFIWIEPFGRFNNCSFFNLLIIDKEKLSDFELQQVLAHESEHKLKLHSLDQLIVECVLAFFWFNPFIYYYKRAINAVHEYEVDQKLSARIDKQSYGNLLLKLAAPSTTYLSHGFSQNSLKRRIQFLFGKRSQRYKKIGYTVLVPLVALIVSVFSFQKVEAIGKMIHIPSSLSDRSNITKGIINAKTHEEKQILKESNLIAKATLLKLSDIIKPVLSGDLNLSGLLAEFSDQAEKPKLTIVLDPGHGGSDKGGSFEQSMEKNIVLQVARNVKDVLEKEGFNVVLTRGEDEFVALKDRVLVKGDVFVSLHANSSVNKDEKTTLNGMDLYIPNKLQLKDSTLFKKSLMLASCMKAELSSLDIQLKETMKEGSLFVLNNNTKPSVLLELGYINNPTDNRFLLDNSYHLKLAGELAKALKKYQTAKYSSLPNPANVGDIRVFAKDSIVLNKDLKLLKLYGRAKVETNEGELSADKIVIDLKTGKGKAEGNPKP